MQLCIQTDIMKLGVQIVENLKDKVGFLLQNIVAHSGSNIKHLEVLH